MVFFGFIAGLSLTPLYAQTSPVSEQISIPDKWAPIGVTQQASKLLTLSDSEKRWLSEHKTIRLGINPTFEPIEFMYGQGNYSGIAADYVKLLSERLGISVHVVSDLNWNQALESAKKGEIDIFAAITPTRDRKNYLSFTEPYFKYPVVIYTRNDFPVIPGLESLSRKKVTVVKNDFIHEVAKQYYPELDLIAVNTTQDGLRAVSEGTADAFIGDSATVTFEIRKNNLTDLKIAAPAGFESPGHSFAVRKDWPELVSMINKVMATISPEEHLAISNKWVQIEERETSRYWFWTTLSAAGFVLLFIVISIISRIQVMRRTAKLSVKNELLENENTERRLAEKALINSEQRLAQFFHATFEVCREQINCPCL